MTVHDDSVEPVKLVTLVDDIYGDLNGVGTCDTGGTIGIGGHYTCSFSKEFTGDAGASKTDTVATATAADDEDGTASATDAATVTLTNRPPTVSVGKTASPTVANVGDSVTFTITVHNTSFEAVTLTELTDDVYGNLDGRGSCAYRRFHRPGGDLYVLVQRGCDLAPRRTRSPAHVADNERTSAHDSASATVTVHPAKVTIVKTADASVAPGGAVGFTVNVHDSGTGMPGMSPSATRCRPTQALPGPRR